MAFSVIENHIFACRSGVAEAVADIVAEALAVNNSVARAPIPGVIVCPDASAPIKRSEVALGGEFDFSAAEFNISLGVHTVDFLIVIKSLFIVCPRRGDYHRVVIIIAFEENIKIQFSVKRALLVMPHKASAALFVNERKAAIIRLFIDVSLCAVRGHIQRAHRHYKGSHKIVFLVFIKIIERGVGKSHISVVGNNSSKSIAVIVNDNIIIPFLDSHSVGFYVKRAVFRNKLVCPAGLEQRAVEA